jgi:hypothetical protein
MKSKYIMSTLQLITNSNCLLTEDFVHYTTENSSSVNEHRRWPTRRKDKILIENFVKARDIYMGPMKAMKPMKSMKSMNPMSPME